MGYSPEDIEAKRKEDRIKWIREGYQAAQDCDFNTQIEESLVSGTNIFNVAGLLPDSLKQRMQKGKPSGKIYIEWFVTGLVQDFIDNWKITFGLLDYGTDEAKVRLIFSPKEKSDVFDIPPIPSIPAMDFSIDKAMAQFEASMDAWGKKMDNWCKKIDDWSEELVHDIENSDDPDIQKKWKQRGLDLKDIIVKTTDGKKSISVKEGASVDLQGVLRKRRDNLRDTWDRYKQEKPEAPKREPTRIEKKVGGVFSTIGNRIKLKLGLANPPASKDHDKTDPTDAED